MADTSKLMELLEKATPGPWYHVQAFERVGAMRTIHGPVPSQRVDFVSTCPQPVHKRIVIPMEREDCPSVRSEDMALIVAAVNALPGLLDTLDVTRRELAEAREDAERYRWLRSDDNHRWWAMFGFVDSMAEEDEPTADEFDAAIDAARKTTKET